MKKLNWHNPDVLTSAQIGIKDGWRLLLKEELSTYRSPQADIHRWIRGKWEPYWCGDGSGTYRVQWPLPEWTRSSKLENQTDKQLELPEGLPKLPKLPTGWRWELKGWKWDSGGISLPFACAQNGDKRWFTGSKDGEIPSIETPVGDPDFYYILAVEDQQEGWIKWSDRQPIEEDLPIICCIAGEEFYGNYLKLPTEGHSLTHWMHDKTPPIPPRELTQEEKDAAAMTEWWEGDSGYSTSSSKIPSYIVWDAWKAAVKYARGE